MALKQTQLLSQTDLDTLHTLIDAIGWATAYERSSQVPQCGISRIASPFPPMPPQLLPPGMHTVGEEAELQRQAAAAAGAAGVGLGAGDPVGWDAGTCCGRFGR